MAPVVLGPILEQNFIVSMIRTEWDLTQFFTRPAAAVLAVLTILIWFAPVYPILLRRLLASPRTDGAQAAARPGETVTPAACHPRPDRPPEVEGSMPDGWEPPRQSGGTSRAGGRPGMPPSGYGNS